MPNGGMFRCGTTAWTVATVLTWHCTGPGGTDSVAGALPDEQLTSAVAVTSSPI